MSPTQTQPCKTDPQLRLTVAHSCHRHLIWDCSITAREDVSSLVRMLPTLGYSDESHSDLVCELRHPLGHLIVLLPSTGRLQIRLHYCTPFESRAPAAESVANELRSLLYPPGLNATEHQGATSYPPQ